MLIWKHKIGIVLEKIKFRIIKKNKMKKFAIKLIVFQYLLAILIIIIFLSSCSPYVSVGSGGGRCGAFAPRKFENDKRWHRQNNWINNSKSGRYRSGF